MAYRYGVTPSVGSKSVTGLIDLLHENLEGVILWQSREESATSMPTVCREKSGLRVVAINGAIDCFDIVIQCPSNLYAHAQTWSSYKHQNTVKYLIGINPQAQSPLYQMAGVAELVTSMLHCEKSAAWRYCIG